jgi:hypothetical protein
MNNASAELDHPVQPSESGADSEEALEKRFSQYEAHGGNFPFSTYRKVVTLAESEKPLHLGRPTKAQALNMATPAQIPNIPKIIRIYGVIRENLENVLESPPEGFQKGGSPKSWSDQEVFAEALLIAGMLNEHEKYTAHPPNIFG